jgi:protein O-mannosyl-transferase
VYANPPVKQGLTAANVVWAFTHRYNANWHPLTTLSHMLDCQLYDLRAGAHHLTSVFLHAINAILLFLVLRRMMSLRPNISTAAPDPPAGALWPAAFVAAVFAVHPLRVESVAWIAERKDVLSGLFFFLTLGAYTGYVRRPSVKRYLLVVVAFALGLLSKSMLVTVPFVLLLLDYWPLQRFAAANQNGGPVVRRLILEKIPLFILSAAFCAITLRTQSEAIQLAEAVSFQQRIANAIQSWVIYLGQFFWPADLAVYYPLPTTSISPWIIGPALLLLLAVSVAALCWRQKRPWFLTGWLWYLGMLVPVIGLIQVGGQAHADRYTYLPQIGLVLLLTWAGLAATASWRNRREMLGGAAAVIVGSLIITARDQTNYWRDSETLWTRTLACTSDENAAAHSNLGNFLLGRGRLDEAIAEARKALAVRPDDVIAHNCLGLAFLQEGRADEAITQFEADLKATPDYAPAHSNLGAALFQIGRTDEAIAHLQKAIELDPNLPDTYNNLGGSFLQIGRTDDAITQLQKALALDANLPDAHNNLGGALLQKGQAAQAIAHFQKALELKPDFPGAANNLAWVLATWPDASCRNGPRAVELARRVNQLSGGGHLMALRTLAAAYAEAGRFPDAIDTASRALELAQAQSNAFFIQALQADLRLYQSGQPLQESSRGR